MKKTLMILGVVFLILIAAVIALLVWGQRSGQAKQEAFFRAVMSGDPAQVTAMFHPALQNEVDEPVLALWMRAAKENLGAFKGLAKTNFSTNVKYVDGAKISESSGKVLFEKGEARSELVFRDDRLVKFDIESDRIPKDWLKAGIADAGLYHERGKAFLQAFAGGQFKAAFDMAHADLQTQIPLEKLKSMGQAVSARYGKVKSLAHLRDEADPAAGTLRVFYRVEGEKGPATADVLFRFIGLKGHIYGFNFKDPA